MPKADINHISEILIKYRSNYYERISGTKKKLSQKGLADIIEDLCMSDPDKYCSVSINTIKNIELKVTTAPRQSTLFTIATALKIPVDVFYISDSETIDSIIRHRDILQSELNEQEAYQRLSFDEKLPIFLSENFHCDILPLLNYLRFVGYIVDFVVDTDDESIKEYRFDASIRSERNTALAEIKTLRYTKQNLDTKYRQYQMMIDINRKKQSTLTKELSRLNAGTSTLTQKQAELDQLVAEYDNLELDMTELNVAIIELTSKIDYLTEHNTPVASVEELRIYAKDKILAKGNPEGRTLKDIPILAKIYQGVATQDASGELHQRTEPFRTMTLDDFVKLCDSISHIIKTIIEV